MDRKKSNIKKIMFISSSDVKTMITKAFTRYKTGVFIGFFLVAVILWLAWPMKDPFPDDYSRIVFDNDGRLLRATLASDQQLRFPPDRAPLPPKYVSAVLACEDKRFYNHVGIDPLALMHAAVTNLKSGQRVRGGSTIPMQVARLARPKKRTYVNKLIECMTAVRLSFHFTKDEILRMYAAHVPMGGNIVGVDAASYRYYGKSISELTWAEAALFVVLPNNPSMINLSRKRPMLMEKRNRLLRILNERGTIDKVTADLACLESLPADARHLPFEAPHFSRFVTNAKSGGGTCRTTLDRDVQRKVADAARMHHRVLADQGIANLAVLAVETQTGEVKGYLGSQSFHDTLSGGQVDGVMAYRSTGSLLKPFLTAKALDRGPYTMASRIQDVPTFYGTFVPQNASKTFYGLVSLNATLIQSLNVPAVRLLNAYGIHDFYDFLVDAGLKGLFRSADGYGLTLILGGAEASLWEMAQLYLCLANMGKWQSLQYEAADAMHSETRPSKKLFSEGAAWLVLNALKRLSRPGSEYYWRYFDNQAPVAWKTGTSYGQKDGWAIGMNKQWVIGVWVGNFTGEGNASISGSKSAAPLMFSIFNTLTRKDRPIWFEEPEYDLIDVECCAESGYPAGPHCPETIMLKRPISSYTAGTCPYHRKYLVDKKTGKSVCSLCWEGVETEWVYRYIVPAGVRDILIHRGRSVDAIPLHSAQCPLFQDKRRFELVYPVDGIKVFIPRDFDGMHERVILSAKHQHPSMHLFWYLNGSLIGETVERHELVVDLNPGEYRLTIQDEEGFTRTVAFEAYRKEASDP